MTSSQSNDDQNSKKPLNFSIEHILNTAGNNKSIAETEEKPENVFSEVLSLPWLQCTRYCPPKIPRRKEAPQKRQLGRHPRIPFSTHQLAVLEEHFKQSPYLSSQDVKQVSRKLDLADIRVKIWFQNRRARERRERLVNNSIDSRRIEDLRRHSPVKYEKSPRRLNSEEFLSLASTSTSRTSYNTVSPDTRGYGYLKNVKSSSPWTV